MPAHIYSKYPPPHPTHKLFFGLSVDRGESYPPLLSSLWDAPAARRVCPVGRAGCDIRVARDLHGQHHGGAKISICLFTTRQDKRRYWLDKRRYWLTALCLFCWGGFLPASPPSFSLQSCFLSFFLCRLCSLCLLPSSMPLSLSLAFTLVLCRLLLLFSLAMCVYLFFFTKPSLRPFASGCV